MPLSTETVHPHISISLPLFLLARRAEILHISAHDLTAFFCPFIPEASSHFKERRRRRDTSSAPTYHQRITHTHAHTASVNHVTVLGPTLRQQRGQWGASTLATGDSQQVDNNHSAFSSGAIAALPPARHLPLPPSRVQGLVKRPPVGRCSRREETCCLLPPDGDPRHYI